VHLASDERGMPLGATITVAAANDGQQTENVLRSMVVQPPVPDQPASVLGHLNLPSAKADGALRPLFSFAHKTFLYMRRLELQSYI